MKKLLFVLALIAFASCNSSQSQMKKWVEDKIEKQATSKGQKYEASDFGTFYAIGFKENADSLAKAKGMTPMGDDDVYWKMINREGWIAGNLQENPFCDLSKVKETAVEIDNFIKEQHLTANCYFVIHKYKITDSDLGVSSNMTAGLVIGAPGEKYEGVLHCCEKSIKPNE